VPTIDQCYTDDQACIWEADQQYKRDKKVDEQILNIIRNRFYNCVYYERNVNEYFYDKELCPKEKADYKEAELNHFIKCIHILHFFSFFIFYTFQ
jgi:NADH dehydrogenase (ubiquinone) 1 beta subcomplex subunit 10